MSSSPSASNRSRHRTSLPRLADWLAGRLDARAMTQAAAARALLIDKPQFNRWINRKEVIPRHALTDIMRLIGTPEECAYAQQLKTFEETLDELGRDVRELAELLASDAESLQARLLTLAETLARQESGDAPEIPPALFTDFLADARFAVRMAKAGLSANESLLSRDNIRRHLQYPLNRFIGLLLEDRGSSGSSPIRTAAPPLAQLWKQSLAAAAQVRRPSDPWQDWMRQHAVHLLSRHGQPTDVRTWMASSDLALRRMAYFGQLLRSHDEALADALIDALDRDDQFAKLALAFDALHYGDTGLPSDGKLQAPTTVLLSVRKLVHSAVAAPQSWARRLGAARAVHALRWHGIEPFLEPHTLRLLVRGERQKKGVDSSHPAMAAWHKKRAAVLRAARRRGLL